METFFKELSEKENGRFHVIDEIVNAEIGARTPHLICHLYFKYKGKEIKIRNTISPSAYGFITCEIQNVGYYPEFSIRSQSNFLRLFRRSKSSFIIKCKNISQKLLLANNKYLTKLDFLAKESQFELTLFVKKTKGVYNLITEYNLLYENRKETLILLISFYKDLIDQK